MNHQLTFDAFNEDFGKQHRMSRLQLCNWGTFSGFHDMKISADGFLLVGASGSGKSTLLDAFSALLVPPIWLGFNAAARDDSKARNDRNLLSYVRGAWADQEVDGAEISTQYLRPDTTWSALALEYQGLTRTPITLLALFTLRGRSTANQDLKRYYAVIEEPFNLPESLKGFDLDIKKLKKRLPTLNLTEQFSVYRERFCNSLNIDSEMTLKLLHKTQSAKNLGDLNLFLREYMLDKPKTFEAVDNMLSEFVELDLAHQSVVTMRQQIETLLPARDGYAAYQKTQLTMNQIAEIQMAIDTYADQQRGHLLQAAIRDKTDAQNRLKAQQSHLKQQQLQAQEKLSRLEEERREQGGGRIEALERDIIKGKMQREQVGAKQQQLAHGCQLLNVALPNTPEQFAELLNNAQRFIEAYEEERQADSEKRDQLRDRRQQASKAFSEVCTEIGALERQPSNIPALMLNLRQRLAEDANLPESQLPFVGELIQVKETAVEWRGAIERVLHGFALSLLVNEKNYRPLSRVINEKPLGGRLIYYRVSDILQNPSEIIHQDSLFNKLDLKPNDYKPWITAQLKRRFNYRCVATVRELQQHSQVLTREGQVRHSKERHEKDDRYPIEDKRRWVLGFNNADKLDYYKQQAQALGQTIGALEQEIGVLEDKQKLAHQQLAQYQFIANLQWAEVDIASVLDHLKTLEDELNQLKNKNRNFQALCEEIEKHRADLDRVTQALSEMTAQLIVMGKERETLQQDLNEVSQKVSVALTPWQQAKLEDYFKQQPPLTLSNLDRLVRHVERSINEESARETKSLAECKHKIERIYQNFKNRWPQESADQEAAIEATDEFLAKLERLEKDGLPEHEARFFSLLRNQSMENLAALNSELTQGRKNIVSRMRLVNESLRKVQFNAGTYLEIETNDRQLKAVNEFKSTVRDILSHAWSDRDEATEDRFNQLRALVERFNSQEIIDRNWKDQVLDVRKHVEFIGREFDQAGKQLEVYRSGAGKSGGQREKLATTCLAAALRYQLAPKDGGLPRYAAVVLDEAFAKADNEFTRDVMKIFRNFGFQMIVATPLKSVITLQHFIGGACLVKIDDRKDSHILAIEYDTEKKQLNLENNYHEQTHAIA